MLVIVRALILLTTILFALATLSLAHQVGRDEGRQTVKLIRPDPIQQRQARTRHKTLSSQFAQDLLHLGSHDKSDDRAAKRQAGRRQHARHEHRQHWWLAANRHGRSRHRRRRHSSVVSKLINNNATNAQADRRQDNKLAKFKRQAVDLAVNRLHILESLDEQLRAFADAPLAGAQHQQQHAGQPSGSWPLIDEPTLHKHSAHYGQLASDTVQQQETKKRPTSGRQQVCTLKLAPSRAGSGRPLASGVAEPANCLSDTRLGRHVPAYMLNLYRQLLADSSGSSASAKGLDDPTIQLMPYHARVMRSFRQPPLEPEHLDAGQNSYFARKQGEF